MSRTGPLFAARLVTRYHPASHLRSPQSPYPAYPQNYWEGNVAWIDRYGLHNGYGSQVGTPGKGMLDAYADRLIGNTFVINNDGEYVLPICSGQGMTMIANNTLYTPTGAVQECGVSLAQWQAQGGDPGTTAAAYPPDLATRIIALARSKLFVHG